MPNDTPTCPECGHDFTYDEQDSTTTSTRARWDYTGTILATVTVISLPLIVFLAGINIITLGAITQGWWIVYTTVVLMAATWTFGKETLEAVYEARSKNK